MNTTPRSNLSLLIILGLIALSTIVLATSLASLHVGSSNTGYSAPSLFNQANADAQQGKIGQAIANYERARLLAPSDPDIAANLKWVREHAGLSVTPTNWLDRAISCASPNTMALLGWLGLVLTGTGILSIRALPKYRVGPNLTAITGIALLTLSAISALATWSKYHEAIIITPTAMARISPVTNGETAFKLTPGEAVSIKGNYHDFALVENSSGHSGWVAQTEITPLIPR